MPHPPAPPPFTGFPDAGFAFLAALAENQNRAWFNDHRAQYEHEIRAPLAALVAALSAELAARKIPLAGDPARALFRIHRDTRFARDKSPYKTNAAAVLTRDGGKHAAGVLYLHLDPAASFAACGFYRPEPASLHALRQAIATQPARFTRMLAALAANRLALAEDEDQLRRPPRGFAPAGQPEIENALRRKSFVTTLALTRPALASNSLVKQLADFAGHALPLLEFGWNAIPPA